MTTNRTTRSLLVAVAVAALATTAACTTSGREEPGLGPDPSVSASSSSASPSASDLPTSASPTSSAPAGFSTDEQVSVGWPELGERVGIGIEARVGAHVGYDRVVYQFTQAGTPRYRVHYVDAPVDQASGQRRPVAGDAWLEVVVSAVDVPGESAPTADDPLPETLKGTGIAAAPAIWGGFEGYGQQFIGLTGEQRPFRVSLLQNPTRVVVDIAR